MALLNSGAVRADVDYATREAIVEGGAGGVCRADGGGAGGGDSSGEEEGGEASSGVPFTFADLTAECPFPSELLLVHPVASNGPR